MGGGEEEVRATRTWKEVGGRKVDKGWLKGVRRVGGRKKHGKRVPWGLDGVRRCWSQTVRQRRQTDRHAGRNENNNMAQRGPGP